MTRTPQPDPAHALHTLREDGHAVIILDQTALPHRFVECRVETVEAAAHAIRSMQVRGAPLIGITAAYGLALALGRGADDAALEAAIALLGATRPTAVNLHWALERMRRHLAPLAPEVRRDAAWREARAILTEDAAANHALGSHGLALIQELAGRLERPVRVMTHCNAGWLATAAYGTALAPVYLAHAAGIAVEVLASETRPRNQGLLTAWELERARIAVTLVADNAAALLLQQGAADLVIVGADRIAANGDTANKIGTCLKALAAKDCGVPFYVAAPRSTIDWDCPDGAGIPIERRDAAELRRVTGLDAHDRLQTVDIAPESLRADNPAFDVTPARLITGILCECGIAAPGDLGALCGREAAR
ncbi:MAG: S-methyl-5-thioribose-1-phosphate isomerase [Betaproteobacteria bacterium]|nr:S-methyl-5-thioribose-1-phosphate isomerase [Betaproteobacteria bacterium]